jgi:transposase
VLIGVDPHKRSHTAAMLDRRQRELGQITVRAGRRQVEQLLEWVDGVMPRRWAVESAGGMGYLLAQQLVAAGETFRRAGDVGVTGAGAGHGPVDQDRCQRRPRSVAVAALHGPTLAVVRPADHVTVCRLLAKRHTDVARWRTKQCCRLHALVAELVPGGIEKEVVVTQARSLLEGIGPQDVAAVERHRQAVELVDDIEHLDRVVKDSRARITAAVAASGTTLTDVFGIGPIIAAMLIGFSGDPLRFTTASRYAAYTGTAPIEFSSGGRIVHRLSRRGNRRLNHALHCAAITQIRHRHRPRPPLLRTQAGRGSHPTRSDPCPQAPTQRRRLAPPRRRRPTRRQPMTRGFGQDTPGTSLPPA